MSILRISKRILPPTLSPERAPGSVSERPSRIGYPRSAATVFVNFPVLGERDEGVVTLPGSARAFVVGASSDERRAEGFSWGFSAMIEANGPENHWLEGRTSDGSGKAPNLRRFERGSSKEAASAPPVPIASKVNCFVGCSVRGVVSCVVLFLNLASVDVSVPPESSSRVVSRLVAALRPSRWPVTLGRGRKCLRFDLSRSRRPGRSRGPTVPGAEGRSRSVGAPPQGRPRAQWTRGSNCTNRLGPARGRDRREAARRAESRGARLRSLEPRGKREIGRASCRERVSFTV